MFTQKNNADRLCMGWWLAGVLAMVFSLQAGALDFNREIQRQNGVANDVKQTLGRDRGSIRPHLPSRPDLPSLEGADSADEYRVELIPVRQDQSS